MRKQTPATLAAALLLFLLGAQSAQAQCTAKNLTPQGEFEKRGIVIDVRPDEINQFSGKSAFRNEAHITLINMNPFLFSYKLKVAQTEVQDTGFLNFLNLLGFPVGDLIGSVKAEALSKQVVVHGGNLALLINRTAGAPSLAGGCADSKHPDHNDATTAIGQLVGVRKTVLEKFGFSLDPNTGAVQTDANGNPKFGSGPIKELDDLSTKYKGPRDAFRAKSTSDPEKSLKDTIFDANVDAKQLCLAADELATKLNATTFPSADEVSDKQKSLADLRSLVKEMKNSAQEYLNEYGSCPARANGLGYAQNLIRLGEELDALLGDYEGKINKMVNESNSYETVEEALAKLKGHENDLLQKEYTVLSQYDVSDLDITVTPAPLKADAGASQAASFNVRGASALDGATVDRSDPRFPRVGDIQDERRSASAQGAASAQAEARIITVSAPSTAQGVRVFAPHARAEADKQPDGGGDKGADDSGGKDIKAKGRIGARRFELSGGIVFSSLDRREFQPVIGFARNEQGQIVGADGNPTDKRDLTKIVGLSQNSRSRFSPMAMMHTRFPYTTNLFFSVGITGKKDDTGFGLEYLLGPSFLFKNMFFTAGAYAGRQQKLAGDLFLGAKLDGDTVPVRNEYKWAPAFSFTYRIPLGGKKETK